MPGMFGELDLNLLAEALARPGMDPRVWISYGIVDRDQDDQRAVTFDPEDGFPLVRVVLQPHNQVVACRVASGVAGNGEGEWAPFLTADEVIVAIPEGDARSTPVIIGRLNNSLDVFPDRVAGYETNKNNFGFRRGRGPYVIEGDSSLIMRSAVTGAMFGIDETGNATMRCGDGNVFQLGANGVAMQNKDGTAQIALDTQSESASIGYGGSALRLMSAGTSSLMTSGALEMSACGVNAVEHLVTLEQLLNILMVALTLPAGGGTFVPTGFPNRAAALAAMAGLLTAAPALPIALGPTDLNAAIALALQMPKPPAVETGQVFPGVGCVGLLGG